MTLDGLAVACLVDELSVAIGGHRVQHIHHSGQDALALELYGEGRRSWLTICTQPAHPAVFLTSTRPARPADEVTPLLLRMRRLVDGAFVVSVAAPPGERIVRLSFAGRDDDGPYDVSLIVELLGPGSVVVLVDNTGRILETSRKIGVSPARRHGSTAKGLARANALTESDARAPTRVIVAREIYQPPPSPVRLDPRTMRGSDLREALASGEAAARSIATSPVRATDALVRTVGACSPLLAREAIAAAGATGCDVEAVIAGEGLADGIADWFRDRWQRVGTANGWDPHVSIDATGDAAPTRVLFAPYRLTTADNVVAVATISEAIAAWHDRTVVVTAHGRELATAQALRQAIEARLDKVRARLFSLQKSVTDPADLLRARVEGDWLLSHPDRAPTGTTRVTIVPLEVGVEDLDAFLVTLDPELDAIAHAQRAYRRYQKRRAAAREVPPLIETAVREREYLSEALVHLDLAQVNEQVRSLRAELAEAGFVSPGKREANRGTRAPNRHTTANAGRAEAFDRITINGFECLIGRSGKGNDQLLRVGGHGDDPWLHARGVAGAHVVVRAAGRVVPDDVVRHAASLAAGRSAARQAPLVPVDVTTRRSVTRITGGPPGLVNYRNERTVQVPPAVPLP